MYRAGWAVSVLTVGCLLCQPEHLGERLPLGGGGGRVGQLLW